MACVVPGSVQQPAVEASSHTQMRKLKSCSYLGDLVLRQVVQQRLQPAPQELLCYLLTRILKAPVELQQTGHVVRRCSRRASLVTLASNWYSSGHAAQTEVPTE